MDRARTRKNLEDDVAIHERALAEGVSETTSSVIYQFIIIK